MRPTTASDHIAIETRGLTRRFGDFTAVDNLDLTITTGTIYGFLGPNGCGKSTSMRLITGLLTPTSGSVQVLGMAIPDNAESLRLRIGYMTQKFSLYEDLSVEENLRFMAQIYNLDTRATKARIAAQLAEYGLDQRRHRLAGSLSGGQRQRLALAAATLHQPELLILDEPTSAVDPENRRDFWEKLFELADAGTTLLVSTHYMDEAERCHQLAILDHGALVANGSPSDLAAALEGRTFAVGASEPRRAHDALQGVDGVLSVAQIGNQLRVLTAGNIEGDAALQRLQEALGSMDGRVEPAPR